MSVWSRFLPRQRIGVRLATAVILSMTLVLLAGGMFVFWRVGYALDRQLDSDLRSYAEVIADDVHQGDALPGDTPGEGTIVYDTSGRVLTRSRAGLPQLADKESIRAALGGTQVHRDLGNWFSRTRHPYRVRIYAVNSPEGRVVVASGLSRRQHDEALRELAIQLLLADLLAFLTATLVGIGVSRAALGPVEDYRRAVVGFGDDPAGRLPVDETKDDELSRLGHTFNDLLDRLAAAHERERGFLANASHELRSPLALLATEIEWAMHRPRTPEEMDVVLTSLRSEVARLVDLSDALLDLEELRSEEIHREPTDLEALVEDAIAPHRRTAEAAGRRIEARVAQATVDVDPRRLELAVRNLVGNALKYGNGTVTVSAFTAGPLVLRVTDEGPGIDPELGERAFDRFTRADRSRTTPGNGLGLALVQAVAQSHGGDAKLVRGGVEIQLPGAVPNAQRAGT